MFSLAVLCVVIRAAIPPSIETDSSGNVIVTMPKGATLRVVTVDEKGNKMEEQLVTKNALQEATEALKADLLLQMGQIASAKVANLQEDLSTTADEAALKVAALQSELSATADEAATELRVVSAKLDAISTDFDEAVEDLGAIATRMEASEVCAAAIANQVGGKFDSTCPEYTGTAPAQCEELEAPEGGKVHGKGTATGATRTFSCDAAHQMVGRSHLICGKDKTWSPAPPTCVPLVTCGVMVDNKATAVYIDGTQHPLACPEQRYHGQHQCTFTFAASAKLLAIAGNDREEGCATGGLVLTCSTTDRGPWYKFNTNTGVNPNSANKWRGLSSTDQDYTRNAEDWAGLDVDDSKWPTTIQSRHMGAQCSVASSSGTSLIGCADKTLSDGSVVRSKWCSNAHGTCDAKDDAVFSICPDDSEGTGNHKGKSGDRSNMVYFAFRHHV